MVLAAALCPALAGCFSSAQVPPEPEPDAAVQPPDCTPEIALLEDQVSACEDQFSVCEEQFSVCEEQLAEIRATYEELVQHHKAKGDDRDRLQAELATSQARLASLEEQLAAIEIELESAVEEAVRTKARVQSVSSRALAISRIAEVRVQLLSMRDVDDEDVVTRLRRAQEFLRRADQVLAEENYGGAAFLADRANELIRDARTVTEIRAAAATHARLVIPIVPPRTMVVLKNSNLRNGPGIEHRRVGNAPEGEEVTAIARSQDWYQVETTSGQKVWISGALVR